MKALMGISKSCSSRGNEAHSSRKLEPPYVGFYVIEGSPSAEILSASLARSAGAILADLVKARLTTLVLLTTFVGFFMGERGPLDFALMFHALAGTALVAAGAAALNQLLEREYDAKMRRTQNRPLPAGHLEPATVMIFGGVSATAGLLYFALVVNLLTSVIGAVTLVSYLFIYTPLKRVTWLNTAVGAVSGALPPLMGWTAARGELSGEGWALFAILALWQMPHFMSIAWIYRADYAKAGFKMLPVVDPDGCRTGEQAVSHALALLFVSLCPFVFKMAGEFYLAGALVLGAGYLWFAVQFLRQLRLGRAELTLVRARQLFLASIIYLPLLLAVMVLDKMR
jgi:protoheme IX farnesyltransferase